MDYIKIPLYLSGPNATVDRTDSVTIGTAGSYGVHAFEVERGRNWDNLSIKATFYQKPDNGENTTTPSEDVVQISVVETGDGLIPIPNELFETETDEVGSTQPQTWVTFSGYDGENLKMNSLRLMLEISDTGPTYTTAFTPTPDIEEQLINAVKELRDAACECATQAGEYSAEAAKSATAAKTSEQNALDSENNAVVSELAAEMSAQSAEESEVKAKEHEDNTQILYEQTKVVADEAVQKVEETKEEALESLGNSVAQAAASASAAKQSETNAKVSETNAASSASAAKTSETNAAESEKNAKASEDAAKVSETNAKTSETNAKASETAAKSSQDAAKASADAAKSSENKAASSASTAQSSATLAITQAQEAQKYAGQAQTAQQTTNQYVTIVNAAKEDVEEYRDTTRGYMQTAQQAATAAQTSRDEAAGFAQQVEERIEDAEEFKNQASVSATAAAQSASQAQSAATNAAAQLELVKDAGEDALKAITNQQATSVLVVQREGEAAVTEIGEAKEDALSAISEASTTATTAITTAQETATTAIDTALDEATQAITAAKEEAASDIDAIVVNSPQINEETGYWMIWDKSADAYVDTTTLARGPQGIQGEKGDTGAVPQFGVVNVTTGEEGTEASASVTGTAENPVLNITIPKGDTGEKGDKGDTGATPSFTIGTVTTVAPDVDASVTIDGTAENPVLNMNIPQGETGEVGPGVQAGGTTGQILVKKSDTDFDTEWKTVDTANPPEYTIVKQTAAEDGYFATYYLTRNSVQTGEKINIPKDYLVKEAELLEVTETDTPYSGAVIGDKYIDFTINTQAADEDERHIYLPVKDLVDTYVAGNGINIADNTVSAKLDTANANGLAVDASGIKLNLATSTTAGAMSGADKAKLDASSTTEQMNQAISEAVADLTDGTTELPYVKKSGDTMAGSLTIGTTTINEFGVIQSDKVANNGPAGNGYGIDFGSEPKICNFNTNDLVTLRVGEPTALSHATTKNYVDTKITDLQNNKLNKNNPAFTGTLSGADATLSGALTGNTATFSGGVTVPLEPGAEGSATSKKYVDDSIAAIDVSEQIEPLAQRVTTAEEEIGTINTNIANITDGTTELPYVTKEEVDINGSPQEVARAYRYTFNNEVGSAHKSSGFGFIDLTPAIVTEVDGTTDFSPLYVGEPEKDIQAATKKYVDESIEAIDVSAQIAPLTERVTTAEGEIDALQTEVSNIKDGTTTLDYMKVTDPNYTGTMSGVNATFSGDVVVPTPDADGEAANKNYVDSAINTAKTEINGEIEDIKDGTTELPYIKDSGDSVTGNYSITGTVTDTTSRTSNLQLANLNTTPDQWADAEYANVKYNSTDKRVDFSLMANTGLTANGVKVSGAEPEGNSDFTTKNYVDTAVSGAKTELEEDIGTVQQTVTEHGGSIETLTQAVNNITYGTTELPYIKNTGDTVNGDYTFNGKINVTSPTESSHVANKEYVDTEAAIHVKKIGDIMSGPLYIDTTTNEEEWRGYTSINGGYAYFGDSDNADYGVMLGSNGADEYPSIDFQINEGDLEYIRIQPENTSVLNVVRGHDGYANVRLADPVEDNDAATKRYVDEGGNNPAGLSTFTSYPVYTRRGEAVYDDASMITTPIVDGPFHSLTLYGNTKVDNPQNLIDLGSFGDGYYNSSGSKLDDTNGLSFSFDIIEGVTTYYASYSDTLKQDISSYSYAITEVMKNGSVYGTRGDSGAVPDTISVMNTGGQPSPTSKIIVSIYGPDFSAVQDNIGNAIVTGKLQIGTDYMISPDHPKEIKNIIGSDTEGVFYCHFNYYDYLSKHYENIGADIDTFIKNYLSSHTKPFTLSTALDGFDGHIKWGDAFTVVPIQESNNGIDYFFNSLEEYTTSCSDKYDYSAGKYIKNIGTFIINGENAASVLSLGQVPTFTTDGEGNPILGTPRNVIKIAVPNCVSGTLPEASVSVEGTRASFASALTGWTEDCQKILSSHFPPIELAETVNLYINNGSMALDNVIFYGYTLALTENQRAYYQNSLDGSICFISNSITTIEQATSYFSTHPLTIKYILNEPEEYGIPEEDMTFYKQMDKNMELNDYMLIFVGDKTEDGNWEISNNIGTSDSLSESLGVFEANWKMKCYGRYDMYIDKEIDDVKRIAQSYANDAKERRVENTLDEDGSYDANIDSNALFILDTTKAATTITLRFREPSDTDYVYTYHFIFRSGATPTVLTLPDGVILPDGFEIEANRIYEINIMENLLSYQSWPVE